jgi:DNA-directed RNA polymerase specialized sigma24 family protein
MDKDEIEALYRQYQSDLLAYLYTYFRSLSGEDHADIVQDTFIKAMTSTTFKSFVVEHKRRAWLYTTAKHASLDLLRRGLVVDKYARSGWFAPEQVPFGSDGAAIKILLQTDLTKRQKQVAYLSWILGWDASTVASTLGIQRKTVGSNLFRARQVLRPALAESEPAPETDPASPVGPTHSAALGLSGT